MLKHFLIIAFILQSFLIAAQLNSGPVARYSFNDGTMRDEAGTSNPKAYGVRLIEDRFGNSNSACFFNGNQDSYLNLGSGNVLKPKRGTISLWVKVEEPVYRGYGVPSNPFIYTRAHKYEDFCEAYYIGYSFSVKKIVVTCGQSEFNQVGLQTTDLNYMHLWYHVVLTYDDKYVCMYFNGVLEGKSKKDFESSFLEGDSVIIGCQNKIRNKRFFYGSIDDIEIYDRVLSDGEVLKLYKAPNPNKNSIILRWVLTGLGIFFLLVIIVWLVKQRVAKTIKREKEKNELNARLIELETRAIRTQMNPHFIFNSLNTLQRFILEDQKEKSYTYLIEFSTLLRKLLESSESDTISLSEEIEILTAYLEIEKLRFDHSFEYKITSEISEMNQVYIPFMMVQPFAENAIWHGLLNKRGLRQLTITFKYVDKDRIMCEIDDNGVGRNFKKTSYNNIKKKSMALDFVRQRLELLQQSTGILCSLEITDKKDAEQNSLGTTVRIIIPKSK